MDPLFLSLDEVLEIHDQQIELYGGSAGLRDPGGLESAVATPRATFGAAITFLLINDWEPTFDEEELVNLVLSVASGLMGKPRLTEIFEARCQRRTSD